jgi:hypothetical protein
MATRKELEKLLRTEKEIVVLTPQAQAVMAEIGLDMALRGKLITAKLVKGWKDEVKNGEQI